MLNTEVHRASRVISAPTSLMVPGDWEAIAMLARPAERIEELRG